ncbi:glucosaminidase domain-containing protein [Catenovulum sediminis]|uniref:Glucosaminidase domain-containing protein n=1 Tax=Catenovulum sediminis TaxID=1740262 RepID=A0ABV1RJ74_9ALTE|nr:glucosaminidase domain-containing protein [Catenovulum sediminis]
MLADKRVQIVVSSLVVIVIAVAAYFVFRAVEDKTPPAPDFSAYPAGKERKTQFFNYFRPIIAERNEELLALRGRLVVLHKEKDNLSSSDIEFIRETAEHYDLDDFDVADENAWQTLLRRVDIVPEALALAQAANESAWGTSRFAKLGNNFFGQWCYKKGCGIVPAHRGKGQKHEVADFDNPKESVLSYINNLNYHPAYLELRRIRETLRENNKEITGVALAGGLGRYSERGHEYIKELRSMIRYNKLE